MVDRLGIEEDDDGVAAIDRWAVGTDSRAHPGAQTGAQGWSSLGGRSEVLRGHPVDLVDWSALGRAPAAIRQLDDLLAAHVRVVEDRGAPRLVACFSRAVERARTGSLERVLHRRDVRPSKKGGACVGPTKRGKGTKLMVLADGAGTPLGVHVDSASPAEVRLVDKTLDTVSVARAHHPGHPRKNPDRLIGDRGFDSNAVRESLARRGIEPIIPCRSNNTVATHQDGRKLRRYKRRWKIERTNSWLFNFRRLVVRYEHRVDMYLGFVHMACALITLRAVMK